MSELSLSFVLTLKPFDAVSPLHHQRRVEVDEQLCEFFVAIWVGLNHNNIRRMLAASQINYLSSFIFSILLYFEDPLSIVLSRSYSSKFHTFLFISSVSSLRLLYIQPQYMCMFCLLKSIFLNIACHDRLSTDRNIWQNCILLHYRTSGWVKWLAVRVTFIDSLCPPDFQHQ